MTFDQYFMDKNVSKSLFINDCVVHRAENTNTTRCRLHEELQGTVNNDKPCILTLHSRT